MSHISNERLLQLLEAADNAIKAKTYSDTFLYNKGNYEKAIFEFLMKGSRVDKSHASFEDIRYEIKRSRTTTAISKVLDSPNTVLIINPQPLPRAFKVFAGTDPKDRKRKLFIDVTGIINETQGNYSMRTNDIGVLTSYLLGGMNAGIYNADPTKIIGNNALMNAGCRAFSNIVYYIVDYLRVSGDPQIRPKIHYLASVYFQTNMMGRDVTDSVISRAKKISGVTDQQINVIEILIGNIDPNKDINEFCKAIGALAKNTEFSLDIFIEKWMFVLGTGTQFATELYPAFANMLIYAYVGSYLNNQKAIEKAAGKDMVDFVNAVISVGSGVLK